MPESSANPRALWVKAGDDRLGAQRGLGVSTVTFKVMPSDARDVLILENTFHAQGGPPRHLHHEQEEWFYVLEGEFVVVVGSERWLLKPGDSLLAPRQVPHVWAHVGPGRGRVLITFLPAGKDEPNSEYVTALSTIHFGFQ